MATPTPEELMEMRVLIRNLSELLNTAIRTKGEMYARDWERMEDAQRKAYKFKHPEVSTQEEEAEATRIRDCAFELLKAARKARQAMIDGDEQEAYKTLAWVITKAEGR